MIDPAERINAPVSRAELERRGREIRTAMAVQGIDVLVMQNNNDYVDGFVRYFTDVPATNGYPVTVVFPARRDHDDDPTRPARRRLLSTVQLQPVFPVITPKS